MAYGKIKTKKVSTKKKTKKNKTKKTKKWIGMIKIWCMKES